MFKVNGILNVFRLNTENTPQNVIDNIKSFHSYSDFEVYHLNTYFPIPEKIDQAEFSIILLHYTLLTQEITSLPDKLVKYLKNQRTSYKIAILQDEQYKLYDKAAFLKFLEVQTVYTCLKGSNISNAFKNETNVEHFINILPGYVPAELKTIRSKYFIPDNKRICDIGYRGRQVPFSWGQAGQEKLTIAKEFREKIKAYNLTTDIEHNESKRIYGEHWYKFLANCKATLGTESGVSVFDSTGELSLKEKLFKSLTPNGSFDDFSKAINLNLLENKIAYRTISPRHFEAAALGVCQILFVGTYSGILEPEKHYIPLEKDFSNFDEVIEKFQDEQLRNSVCQNAYNDLIQSESYSYKYFIHSFDKHLTSLGHTPSPQSENHSFIKECLTANFNREISRSENILNADAILFLLKRLKREKVSKVVLWGAGKHSISLVPHLLNEGLEIGGFIDSKAEKVKTFLNLPVYLPNDYSNELADGIILSSDYFEEQMIEQLSEAKIDSPYFSIYKAFSNNMLPQKAMKILAQDLAGSPVSIYKLTVFIEQHITLLDVLNIQQIIDDSTLSKDFMRIPVTKPQNINTEHYILFSSADDLSQYQRKYDFEPHKLINLTELAISYNKMHNSYLNDV